MCYPDLPKHNQSVQNRQYVDVFFLGRNKDFIVAEIDKNEKVLQKEIEERGREINSLVRRCQSTAVEGATAAPRQRLCRFAQHLERNWHHIWIRSLETQCLTEQHLLRQTAVTAQNAKEASDIDSDEGPLRKQRRLTLDPWTATMDRLRKEQTNKRKGGATLQTRDVGVLCSERVPVNDKCIMVGTTGIAALKAEYGDDFTNFEIIQDVGYSSESSTHLSGDDAGLDHHFNVRIYKYTEDDQLTKPISLREELESVARLRNNFHHCLGSSLESSSSAAASLDDSGLGTGEALTAGDSSGDLLMGQFREDDDYYEQEELDYLETVLDECVDFGVNNVASDPEELHFNLSGLDSDDPSDNFHNRSSFTTSAQVFYKMISVDSDNGEADNNANEDSSNSDNNNNISSVMVEQDNHQSDIATTMDNSTSKSNGESFPGTLCNDSLNEVSKLSVISDSDPETFKPVQSPCKSDWCDRKSQKFLRTSCSSPKLDDNHNIPSSHHISTKVATTSDSDPETFTLVQSTPTVTGSGHVPQTMSNQTSNSSPKRAMKASSCHRHCHNKGVKRKRDYENMDAARMSNRVRSWLKRCTTDFSAEFRVRRPASRTSATEDLSSCDASCEGTSSSSSADEGNLYSSRSSFCEDDIFRVRSSRVDSSSAHGSGSVETVLHALLEDPDFPFLLPPPPSSTASSSFTGSGSKNYSGRRVKKRDSPPAKASSDGDVEKLKSPKESSKSPTHRMLPKRHLSKTSASRSGQRLHSSLPTVLCHSSDSSTDDNYCALSTLIPSHSDAKTSSAGCANHHSSSSEFSRRRRRRSRKKSSSSNRSSTSVLLSGSDGTRRHRSRTLTSSTSRCESRRRHRSQKSDIFCTDAAASSEEVKTPLKVEIPPVEENAGFDELRRASSALLSPAESDIVLTHLEEQSTVSDQVWDGYQEMPYLSEGYSEATVDEDVVRKLTEFGDDYGSAIGQPVRLLEPPDGNNNKTESLKSPKKCPKSIPITARLSSLSDDSDSDSEDLYYVIEETGKALNFARDILQRRQDGEPLTAANYAELLATCGTHLRCLQTICNHIDGQEHKFSASHLKQLHYLIGQWQELQRNTEMFEKSEDDPARQKYLKAQENIDALYNRMSQLSSCSYLDVGSLASWEDVEKNMARLQMVLTSLQESKEQLLSVNLQVHRFTTEYSDDDNYKDCSLKDDITELYRQWEDTYEQNGTQLTELEALKTDWEVYNETFRHLRLRVKEAEFGANEEAICDNSADLISRERDSLRKDLGELERCAALLESRLEGGEAWKTIQEELRDLRLKICRADSNLRRTASTSVNHRSPSSRVEEDADDHFEDAIQQLCEDSSDDSDHSTTPLKKDAATSMTPKRTRGRFWRIVRVAVPVQFALVLLYCLACYLEPSCCNALNNFNFSFTPQLRYLGGRPPV